jgi:sodium/bile acid cotransporter 7
MDTSVGNVFIMIGLVFFLLALMMIFAWFLLRLLFPDQPRLQVMGLFGCTHKSIAMGIPLINAIYEDNPSVGFYTLPLLVWHPLQLIIGSFLAPHLRNFVKTNEEQTDIQNGTAIEENETST